MKEGLPAPGRIIPEAKLDDSPFLRRDLQRGGAGLHGPDGQKMPGLSFPLRRTEGKDIIRQLEETGPGRTQSLGESLELSPVPDRIFLLAPPQLHSRPVEETAVGRPGPGQGSPQGRDCVGQAMTRDLPARPGGFQDPDSTSGPPSAVPGAAGGTEGLVPLPSHGIVAAAGTPIEKGDQGHGHSFPNRSRRRSSHTFQTASRTIRFDILDSPVSRSVNTMGISRGWKP